MTQYGSLMNLLQSQTVPKVPEVGDGATVLMWSDRVACTVVEVSPSGKRLWVTRDNATRTDAHGMSDAQSYGYETQWEGYRYEYSLRQNGRWVAVGQPMNGGEMLGIGYRQHYHDYSF